MTSDAKPYIVDDELQGGSPTSGATVAIAKPPAMEGAMLQRFAEEIWTADGPTVTVAGFDYPTRMIVIRLSDGGLFLWSPVALSADTKDAVDALGPVRHIVAPNTLHHLSIEEWHRAYPEAALHGLPELRARKPDVGWADDLVDAPSPAWSRDIDQVVVRGNRITTEAVFFHRSSQTAIFADLIQHFEPGWFRGWRALVARLDLLTSPKPTVPRKFRVAFRDRDRARASLRMMLAWPTRALLMAHGAPVERDGQAAIAHAFAWLHRP